MRFRHSRGFTLIELLVVISIIGMLSSVVLASVQAARDKGRVAAGLKFATYNYHALGVDMLGYWDFNSTVQCAVVAGVLCVPDIAGGKLVLKTMTGADNFTNGNFSSYISNNTPTGKGSSAKMDGSHFFGTASDANLNYHLSQTDFRPENFTLSAWVYIGSQPSQDEYVIVLNGDYSDMASIFIDANLRFGCYSAPHSAYYRGGTFSIGKWYHVACSFNGQSGLSVMFVDGKEVARNVASFDPSLYINDGPITKIGIGYNFENTENYFSNGNIDDVAIYTTALVASSIEQLYLAGLPDRMIVQK